ncbi:MAG: nucleotidyltransferase [Deltaproteobacteria bacterium]|nr:nucleotidyltransferase [Deltaproteobacteria bacterium]
MIGPHLQLFKSLNDHGVEYLLIGGVAAIAYGVPRGTKDIDIFIEASKKNAAKCLMALKAIGFGTAALTTPQKLCRTEVTIMKDVVRLDVLTRVKGITFEEAYRNRAFFEVDETHIPALSRADLVRTKKAAGRKGDLEDVEILESVQIHSTKK